MILASRKTTPANAEPVVTESSTSFFSIGRRPRHCVVSSRSTKGELSLVRAQFERADKIIQYSIKYGITAGMATNVFDASLREGIDPELAFRLVRGESEFNAHAISKVGAIGLTQLMPSTAEQIEKGVTREELFNGKTNLRIGFRYLRSLLDQYQGDVRLALLAYNRGEDAVWRDVRAGVNPGNGYDRYRDEGLQGQRPAPVARPGSSTNDEGSLSDRGRSFVVSVPCRALAERLLGRRGLCDVDFQPAPWPAPWTRLLGGRFGARCAPPTASDWPGKMIARRSPFLFMSTAVVVWYFLAIPPSVSPDFTTCMVPTRDVE